MTDKHETEDLVNIEGALLFLMGFATSTLLGYLDRCSDSDLSTNAKWLMTAIEAVVYNNEPLPPLPPRGSDA